MSRVSKILVITLEAGEAELQECISAIKRQELIEFEHVVVRGLNERSAHKSLVSIWQSRKDQFDYMVKVDADTVLISDRALASMSDLMQREHASGLQVRLLDYFSQELIPGLNMFSREVKFKAKIPRLKPDQIDYGHSKVLKGITVANLEPIGLHGKYPLPKQSFFFGYHRWLKGQVDILKKCFDQWKIHGDEARKWALIGALSAHETKFGKLFFSSERVAACFEQVCSNAPSDTQLSKFIVKELLSHV